MSLLKKPKAADSAQELFKPKAPAIEVKLKDAEMKLADLMQRRQQAAFETESDVPGASEKLADIKSELPKVLDTVADLKAAHTAALEQDERERRAILAEHRETIIRSCRTRLAARDAAAARLSNALAEYIKEYKTMLSCSKEAKAAVPEWGIMRGKQIEADELYKLVQKEIARLNGLHGLPLPMSGQCPVPGGDANDLSMRLQPELMKPLADVLKEATVHVLDNLSGKAG